MTKDEAINAMQKGERVTHKSFEYDEWVTIEGHVYKFEDGCSCFPSEFWRFREGDTWLKDWKLFTENNEK